MTARAFEPAPKGELWKPDWSNHVFSLDERERRWKRVRELMKRDGIDLIVCLPCTNSHNRGQADARYLSQLGENSDESVVAFPLEGHVTAWHSRAGVWPGSNWLEDIRSAQRGAGGETIAQYVNEHSAFATGTTAIAGLSETLGRNGVCSNYSPKTASYTWDCVQQLKAGDKIVCTQPPMPFKCPGAPQKIAYLIADRLRRRGILKDCKLDFFTHAPAIFGVPYFARALVKVAARYGIGVHYQQNLVAVDGNAKTATFEFVGDTRKGEKEIVPFDLLHVSPPQSPHDEIKASPLVNAAGWVEVNQATMQHVRFTNVYSLGDVCSTPNSKTAAAVRKQAPVVANEIVTAAAGKLIVGAYDGYASCPLTTAIGKTILAEFCYGGKVTPTLPLNPSKERWVGWWIAGRPSKNK